MLSLIRTATKAPPFKQTRLALISQRVQCTNPTALAWRPMLKGISFRNTRSRELHHSPRSHFSNNSAAAAAASSGADSPSSQPSGKAAPSGSESSSNLPDKNNKSNGNSVDTPSSGAAKQTSSLGSSAKRRLKIQRGSGKGIIRTAHPADPATKVYVPMIPESFLTTHYHPVSMNSYDISTIPYHVHESILNELLNTMASCLLSPHSPQTHIQRMPARHNNLIISSPSEGSSRMLETLTMAAAKKIGADVITVDMQDLMELTPDIFNSKGIGNSWPVDHLSRGFNPFVAAPVPFEFMEDMVDDSDDDFDEDTDEDDESDERERGAIFINARAISTKARQSQRDSSGSPASILKEKFEKFWTALLLAGPGSSVSPSAVPRLPARDKSLPKILYLKDIADIVLTPFGTMLLPSLTSAVLTLRRAGHNIVIVAGHSPSLLSVEGHSNDDNESSNELRDGNGATSTDSESTTDVPLVTILQKLRSPTEHGHHQSLLQYGHISLASLTYDTFPGPTQSFHHISIPPFLPATGELSGVSESPEDALKLRYALENIQQFKRDKANKIKEVNCRNLHAVMLFRGGILPASESPSTFFGTLRGVDSEVWGFGKVFRIISNAIGSLHLSELERKGAISTKEVISQQNVISALDAYTENFTLRKQISSNLNGKKEQPKPLVRAEECDRYERKLLGSIVDPNKIKTTFKNTIIPPETIQTLQTMITLPLVRPQLFSYGLLQNEFLSGLLLFGPPGTGKTLLAKAVAKESGARMLEVKASDIFDMYVGEGEKNVSAVFSLARKLSPCVIFLDEVDSIFRARGSSGSGGSSGGGGNSSQREILNQFMVEWDGLRSSGQNHGIVVMASTNRPFELDDAVLRRLPRRILVDLPSEQAREQILNVYLEQEQLEDVDIKELAKKTAFFSGSDLKNLCVSAALASVREEVEIEVRNMQPTDHNIQTADVSPKEKDSKILDLTPLLNQYKKDNLNSATTKGSSTASDSDTTLPPRVIRKRHIEKAFSQITPSCSENMDSLTELRKWDGLYGDGGKGRRKAVKGIGFEVEPSLTTDKVKA